MRIVLITSDVPATSSMPGSPRAFCLFRYLAERHEVHLATFTSSIERYEAFIASGQHAEVFKSIHVLPRERRGSFWGMQWHRLAQAPYFLTRYRFPGESRIIQWQIRQLVEDTEPDLLFSDGLPAAQYIRDLAALPRVVEATDAISLNFRRAATHADSPWKKLRLYLEAVSIRRFEVATALRVEAYLVSSPIDQEALQSYHPGVKVWCIPNGVDMEYFAPDSRVPDERTIVFTGVMNYAPNRDAAHFLCKEILPRVRDVIPDIQAQLVGSDPPDDVRALAENGVTVTGTVPDVRPFVHRAAVYVSPLRFGTGVKNKILVALAMGKAVVATTESCAGLDITPGRHLLVADTPEDFAAHIVGILADPNRRRHLGIAGRNLVVQQYGWDAMAQQLEALLQSLVFPTDQPRRALDKSFSGGRRAS